MFVLPYLIYLVRVVVVSENMLYFKLENINTNYFWNNIVSQLQHSLSKEKTLENKIMVIKLQDIVNDNNNLIPMIEHKKT